MKQSTTEMTQAHADEPEGGAHEQQPRRVELLKKIKNCLKNEKGPNHNRGRP